MNNPKVSIVIPVYNGSKYLKNAIECALNQTYKNVEVIIVNDGSSDEGKSEEIALSYGDKVRYFYKENGGVSSALNYGISQMTGEYFSWLSHDDGYSTTKIEDSIILLNKNNMINKKCIAFTEGYFIDSKGEKINNFKSYFSKERLYSGDEVVDIMTRKGTLNGCCMLIPRMVFHEVGLFNEELRYSQDSLMWYKIFLNNCFLISDGKPNVVNRIHSNQVSQTRRDLYEHDALYIAKILSTPLSKVKSNSEVLHKYIVRLFRHQCHDAIKYLLMFAKKNRLFSFKQKISLIIYMILGKIRYQLAKIYKSILLIIRDKRR